MKCNFIFLSLFFGGFFFFLSFLCDKWRAQIFQSLLVLLVVVGKRGRPAAAQLGHTPTSISRPTVADVQGTKYAYMPSYEMHV